MNANLIAVADKLMGHLDELLDFFGHGEGICERDGDTINELAIPKPADFPTSPN